MNRKSHTYKRFIVGKILFFFLLMCCASMFYGQSSPVWDVRVFENNKDITKVTYNISSLNFRQANVKGGKLYLYAGGNPPQLLDEKFYQWVKRFIGSGSNSIMLQYTLTNSFAEGFYSISIKADDGFRLFLDNNKINERWNWDNATGNNFYTNYTFLDANSKIKIEYNNGGGYASELDVRIEPIPIDKPVINAIPKVCEGDNLAISANYTPIPIPSSSYTEEFIWHIKKTAGHGATSVSPAKISLGNTYRDFNMQTDYPFGIGYRKFGIYEIRLERKVTINGKALSFSSEPKTFKYGVDGGTKMQGSYKEDSFYNKVDICLNQSQKPVMEAFGAFGTPPYTIRFENIENPSIFYTRKANTDSDEVSVELPTNTLGTFNYRVIVTDSKNCSRELDSKFRIVVHNAPQINIPTQALLCMPKITNARYENNQLIIDSNQYELKNGDTSLDVTYNNTPCCTSPVLKWKITGVTTTEQTGQPSASTTPVILPNNTNTNKEYTITYWLLCGNRKYSETTRKIIVTPRPTILE